MGPRAQRTRLDKVTFNLIPPLLETRKAWSVDDVLNAYIQAYIQVYGEEPKMFKMLSDRAFQNRLEENATACGCSILSFCVIFMQSYRDTHTREERFSPSQMQGEKAVERVKARQKWMRQAYASTETDDAVASMFLTGTTGTSAREVLLDSEVMFGQHIVGHKIRNAGGYLKTLFHYLEGRLAPVWLVSDLDYKETVFDQHFMKQNDSLSRALKELRHSVAMIAKRLRHNSQAARAIFNIRSSVVPQAVEIVLAEHGLEPRDLEAKQSVYKRSSECWEGIGRALQHIYCMRFLDGDPRAERMLRRGSAVLKRIHDKSAPDPNLPSS